MTLPSYYLGDMERRRQRSKELREGLGDASDKALKSMDIFSKLEEKLYTRGKGEEEQAYKRERDVKEDERFDVMMALKDKLATSNLEGKTATAELANMKAKALETKTQGENLSKYVAAGRAQGTTPEFLAKDDPEADAIYAEHAKQEREAGAATKKEAVQQSQIDKNEAAAEKLRRKSTGAPSEKTILANKKARLMIEKLERELSGPAKPKGAQIQAGEAEQVVELKTLLGSVAAIKAAKPDVDTGFFSNIEDEARGMVGKVDPDRAAFKAMVGDQFAAYIKNISGATVSEPERAALLANVPTMKDDDVEFGRKLDRLATDLERKLKIKIDVLQAIGRDVSGLQTAGQTPQAAAPQAAAMTEEQKRARRAELLRKAQP